jgi:two-component system sensor histidine kinase BarA
LKTNFLKHLDFKNRKRIHYGLIVCIVALQIIAMVVWYNETINETKLEQKLENVNFSSQIAQQSNQITSTIIESQRHFNDYIKTKDKDSFESYIKSISETKTAINNLELNAKKNEEFNEIWKKKQDTEISILKISTAIDSIINNQNLPGFNGVETPLLFNPFLYNKILDSVKTNTYVSVDSIAKKGLIGRLLAAISGKVEVQKEHSNTVVTMKYMDKVKTGTVEEQMKRIFQITNYHYKKEFEKLNKNFNGLRQKEMQLMNYNNQLLLLAQTSLPYFTDTANKFKTDNQENLKQQLKTNKAMRSYAIAALILLMFIISLLLFGLTQLSFQYEKILTIAKEKISQNLNFKNRIMGMISHEIRSPLSIISLYSNRISQTIKDKDIKDSFKSVQFTTNSLILLSNQILEYSKDEGQKLTLKNKNFSLKCELEQILIAMKSLVESHENKLIINLDIQSNEEVYSDVAKIHQLFYNIIGNANKFTNKGVIKVNLSQTLISDFELKLDVVIQDNGTGIAKDNLTKIFDPYYQGETTSNQFLGVGLGLNLCKEIVELLEGEISIESQENQGTKVIFNLTLPRT